MQISVPEGTTVFDAARIQRHPDSHALPSAERNAGGRVPRVRGGRGRPRLAASCVRPAENKMVVTTNSTRVQRTRRTLVEMLMADHPSPCARQRQSNDCELETLARMEGIGTPRFPRRISPRGQDNSSLAIAVDHEACILCDRCIRGCDEIRHNDVLGRRGKGFMAGHRVRHQPADGQLVLRLVRRMHGFVPHRRAHQQERGEDRAAGRAGAASKNCSSFRISRKSRERSWS